MGNLPDRVTVEIRVKSQWWRAKVGLCAKGFIRTTMQIYSPVVQKNSNLHDGILQGYKYETVP
jgi:hypothetical protein